MAAMDAVGVKRTQLDAIFSQVVRTAANCCQAHDVPVLNGGEWVGCHGELECCHVKTRSYKMLRVEPLNVVSMCSRHHAWFTMNPASFGDFMEKLRPGNEDFLNELIRERKSIKWTSADDKAARAHYREELKRIIAERDSGVTGPIQVIGYL